MSRDARRGARLVSSVGVATTCAVVLFGVGLALSLPWLCILAVIVTWLILGLFYSVLNRLGDSDE